MHLHRDVEDMFAREWSNMALEIRQSRSLGYRFEDGALR